MLSLVRRAPRFTPLSARAFSTTRPRTEEITLGPPACYVSHSTDPWFNLSYEDWLLRYTPVTQPILFVYRNIPCVVIGRNQNPWKETTPRYLREIDLPLVRRRSGGGTVYHDLGNTNFSVITPRALFTRNGGAELVSRAVRERLDVPSCTVNERNDVVLRPDGTKEGELKVSGSAYKIISQRAYHHGTMLISSDVENLGAALRSSNPKMETKGIASHRAPVSTINAYRAGEKEITHDDFVRAVRDEFCATYPGDVSEYDVHEEDVEMPQVAEGMADMKSWEWQYGQTPEFTNVIHGQVSAGKLTAHIASRHALITECTIELDKHESAADDAAQDALEHISLALRGLRYENLEGVENILGHSVPPDLAWEVLLWLRGSM
ncbi:hypothetical protein CspHIS471_0506890 [Cutaneotrichosporon sp. HIS471]|nr:hypothetical protein CspHIS471_0506890 [Cutaneotrichosporon sp. HIS471]